MVKNFFIVNLNMYFYFYDKSKNKNCGVPYIYNRKDNKNIIIYIGNIE